jgi:xanthine dehydrogenase accessory factor
MKGRGQVMLDREALAAACAVHGRIARVVVAEVAGSAPREAGAAMLVWADGRSWGQSGTIGGGALEWEAAARARALLLAGDGAGTAPPGAPVPATVERIPLGPALGQCCGGAVVLVTEVFDAAAAAALPADVHARALDGRPMPLAVRRLIDRARAQGAVPGVALVQGWLVEPVARPSRAVWVWGAGHVGRAIVGVLAPLPGLAVTWVDVAADRFPDAVPPGVTVLHDRAPEALVARAPRGAEHLIVTFSHALDLALCHALLARGFAACGLIGSATKWARFRARLAALGHRPEAIAAIRCPIGDPGLGKHPQAIAIGVAADILAARTTRARQETAPWR